MTIRFEHYRNGRNLHSHEIPAHVPTGKHEVSCYRLGDEGDESALFLIDMLLSMFLRVSHTYLIFLFVNIIMHRTQELMHVRTFAQACVYTIVSSEGARLTPKNEMLLK